MYFVDRIDVPGLGNRGYLAGGPHQAVVVDPPRDIDRVIEAAARRGVRVTHVVETHVHNDYVTGGLELARITGAAYLVPAGARVAYDRVPVTDGDSVEVEEGLVLRALATPGHTPHHTAYVLEEGGRAVAVFTGGSLLIGTVGRPDLVEPRLTGELARAQYDSAHRLAAELPDETAVLPTHGFGSFCSAGTATGDATTIGRERVANEALVKDADTFVAELLAGLDDVPAYYAHMGPVNSEGPAPVDLTPPAPADAVEIAARLAAGEWVVDLRNRVAFAEGHVAGSVNFEAAGQLATYLAWLVPWGKPITLLAESTAQLADAQRELVRVGIDRPAAAATGSPAAWLRPGEQPRTFPRRTFADLAVQLANAQQELVRTGVDRPSASATGSPAVRPHPVEQPRAAFDYPAPQPVGIQPELVRAGIDRPAASEGPLTDRTGQERKEVVILDVRRDSERAGGHVAGSLHIPLHQVRERLAEIPGGTVWVHCAGGMRAAIAASLLDAAGRTVVAVDDGFAGAREAGLPLAGVTPAEAHGPTGTDGTAVPLDVRETEPDTTGHSALPADREAGLSMTRVAPAEARELTHPNGTTALPGAHETEPDTTGHPTRASAHEPRLPTTRITPTEGHRLTHADGTAAPLGIRGAEPDTAEHTAPAAHATRITPTKAHKLTHADGTAVLLDVREAEEWAVGHAVGAVHVPLSALAAGVSLPRSAQGRPLVAICRSGKRSQEAVTLLAARGAEVSDVVGGMGAWVEAGLPVVTGGELPAHSGGDGGPVA